MVDAAATGVIRQPASATARADLGRVGRYPASRWGRLAVVGAFWAPGLVFAALVAVHPVEVETANAVLAERVAAVHAIGIDGPWMLTAFPPIGYAIGWLAGLLGPFGPPAIGTLAIAILLQRLTELIILRRFDRVTGALLVTANVGTPLLWFLATSALTASVALAALGVGVIHQVRFVTLGQTASGFVAALLYALVVFTDTGIAMFAFAALLVSPVIRSARWPDAVSRTVNAVVLLFPSLIFGISWWVVSLVVTADSTGPIDLSSPAETIPAGLTRLGTFLATPGGLLFLAPALVAVGLSVATRRWLPVLGTAVVYVFVLGGIVIDAFGVPLPGITHVALTVFAVSLMPRPRSLSWRIGAWIALAALLAIAWATAFNRPAILAWTAAVLGIGS